MIDGRPTQRAVLTVIFSVLFFAFVVWVLFFWTGCRLATPEFQTGQQTNSAGEVWTPGK